MRSKNYGINVRVTEQEKQKLLENARFCSLSLSEYLRRLGLGKEVRAAIRERDYRLFRMLNGLKAELPQLQKEEIDNPHGQTPSFWSITIWSARLAPGFRS